MTWIYIFFLFFFFFCLNKFPLYKRSLNYILSPSKYYDSPIWSPITPHFFLFFCSHIVPLLGFYLFCLLSGKMAGKKMGSHCWKNILDCTVSQSSNSIIFSRWNWKRECLWWQQWLSGNHSKCRDTSWWHFRYWYRKENECKTNQTWNEEWNL